MHEYWWEYRYIHAVVSMFRYSHEYRFNGINTLRVVICHDKNKSHKVSVSVKNQYRIESKNLASLIFEHDDRIHNTLKDNRKRQGSEPSTPIHCWRPAGGWGAGEGGDAGGTGLLPVPISSSRISVKWISDHIPAWISSWLADVHLSPGLIYTPAVCWCEEDGWVRMKRGEENKTMGGGRKKNQIKREKIVRRRRGGGEKPLKNGFERNVISCSLELQVQGSLGLGFCSDWAAEKIIIIIIMKKRERAKRAWQSAAAGDPSNRFQSNNGWTLS